MKYQVASLLALGMAQPCWSQGTELGGGIITRTDVAWLADLTKDIRDMYNVIENEGGSDAALAIYLDGKNSERQIGVKSTLSQLGTELAGAGVGAASPQYLFHLFGMGERDIGRLSENLNYADEFVRTAILEARPEAPTAALVLNIWMYATQVLFRGLDTCQKILEADNPSQFDLGTAGFDEFIALWIGAGTTPGSADGDSLYSLAEDAYEAFGGELDEAPQNTKIKALYQEASTYLSIPGICTQEHLESPRKLWSIASQIISQMQISNIRQLIDAVVSKDRERTEVFTMAVVPQAAQCRPSVYKRLRDFLMTDNPRFDKTNVILRDLQDVYACFGLSCEDIGEVFDNQGVDIPECIAADPRAPMAEYNPTSDVQNVSSEYR